MTTYDYDYPSTENNPIPIRLIVKNKPDSLCLPNDDGIDTVYKSVYTVDFTDAIIFGDYYGYDTTNPGVYYIVNIGKKYIENKNWTYFYINNLHNSCIDTAFFTNMDIGTAIETRPFYKAMYFDGTNWVGNGCKAPVGVEYLADGQDSLIIDYSIVKKFQEPRTKMKFIGKRIK